jgi:hypothetical protein
VTSLPRWTGRRRWISPGGLLSALTTEVKIARQGDNRRALSEFLIKLGLVPLSLEEKVPSLEEAFVTITQENVAMLAHGGKG